MNSEELLNDIVNYLESDDARQLAVGTLSLYLSEIRRRLGVDKGLPVAQRDMMQKMLVHTPGLLFTNQLSARCVSVSAIKPHKNGYAVVTFRMGPYNSGVFLWKLGKLIDLPKSKLRRVLGIKK